jgi:hypothetical protein
MKKIGQFYNNSVVVYFQILVLINMFLIIFTYELILNRQKDSIGTSNYLGITQFKPTIHTYNLF